MFQNEERVGYSMLGENRRMTLPAIVDVLQDCSNNQSQSLGIGVEYLTAKQRAWLLNFWQIQIRRYPGEGEKLKVETRAWKFERFYGQRNFAIYDAEGEALVKANSLWFFVNTERMRPVRPDPEDIEPYGVDEPLEMDYAPGRKIALPEQMEEKESFPVLHLHLDTNHHVNNGQYVAMAWEYLPEDREPEEIRVEYRQAAKYGDRIFPRVGRTEDGWTVVALCNEEGTPYAIVEGH